MLGPLLFLVYINDLEKGIKSSIKFFADDTSLFSTVRDPNLSAKELNDDLKMINEWAFQWKMSFNPDPNKPAEEIIFSRRYNRPIHPPLYLNNVEVKRVDTHKHIGFVLDSKLNFVDHITGKIKKARKGIGIIKYLSSYVPVHTLDQIYKMHVRSHLDFCDVIYHLPEIDSLFDCSYRLTRLMNQIERVQYQAALAITGTWQGTNTDKIYEELGWESLSNRRWFHRLVHFYKIQNNMAPEYLKNHIPPPNVHHMGTRSNNIPLIKSNRNYFKNSFFPDSISTWNLLDSTLKEKASLGSFKCGILDIIRPKKKSISDIHNPVGVK